MMLPPELKLIALPHIPEVQPGDDLAFLISTALSRNSVCLLPRDILVVAQKIVSKSENRLLELSRVRVGQLAEEWARENARDPKLIQIVLNESSRIVRMDKGRLIVETHGGQVCANAGVDLSNVEPGSASLLPLDADASAEKLRASLLKESGVDVGVIISDTFGRPWRIGQINIALGVAGLSSLIDYRGRKDSRGRSLQATQIAVADEIASAAELLMGKTRQVPVVLVRGLRLSSEGPRGKDLVRSSDLDLFR